MSKPTTTAEQIQYAARMEGQREGELAERERIREVVKKWRDEIDDDPTIYDVYTSREIGGKRDALDRVLKLLDGEVE